MIQSISYAFEHVHRKFMACACLRLQRKTPKFTSYECLYTHVQTCLQLLDCTLGIVSSYTHF